MPGRDPFPLPRGWTKRTRSSVLHAVSVAFIALTRAWASAATGRNPKTRLRAELDRAETEIALLREELAIKDARWSRVPARRRPHYGATDRMRILKLKAARGWSREDVARVFTVTEETIANWLRRVDEAGPRALVQLARPVNRFPDYVADLVRWLKAMCPTMGKRRIADALARAGLQLGATTVGRMLKDRAPIEPSDGVALEPTESAPTSRSRARHPDHIWHVDLTVVPTSAGFWVPWLPHAKVLRWPFCWWLAVVIDQFSRRVHGFALFRQVPDAADVCAFLERVTSRIGRKPKHVVTDKGRQFDCVAFRSWCRERGIRVRYGAVRRHGSIAVIERFIRSMKTECTRRILVPFRLDDMRRELACYATWYNEHRPHQAHGGMSPGEVYREAAAERDRIEPRPRWPLAVGVERVQHVRLVVRRFAGRQHLPVVELKRAA